MPIITQGQADAGSPLVPEPVAPVPQQPRPGLLDTAAAAFRQSNILSSAYDKYVSGGYDYHPDVPSYDPFINGGADIKGFEDYADRFANANSPEQTQQIKNQITTELQDKETLARAGGAGFAVSLAAGVTDPISLTAMLIPGLEGVGLSRLARVGAVVATNVAAGEAQSAALAYNQETGSYTDGIIPRIGVNALLAGVLGGIATRIPRAELDAAAARARAALDGTQIHELTLEDSISPEGPVSEKFKVFVRSDGSGFAVGEDGRLIDLSTLLKAGKTPEEALAAVTGTSGDAAKVSRAAEVAPEQLHVNPTGDSTAGAAGVHDTTLEDESIAKGGGFIAKWLGRVSPVTRIFTNSPVAQSRRLAQMLVDPGFMLNKNLRGVATTPSIEMKVNQRENFRNSQLFKKLDSEFTDYKKEGGELSKAEFSAAVADAMRNNDTHEIKQVTNVAKFTRRMFQADRKILTELGVMKEGEDVVGAPTYFPRAYDMPMVLNRQTELENRLTEWFTNNPKPPKAAPEPKAGEPAPAETTPEPPVYREPAEVRDAVRDTINTIMGMPRGVADLGQGIRSPSVLKGRTLDVPDEILKPYLSHDFEHVMSSYNRAILPQVEMRRTFGSADLANEFQQISDAYKIKNAAATSDAEKAKLSEQEKADRADLELLRDRVLHQVGPNNNTPLAVVQASQIIRSFNYLRVLGGQTLSAVPDLGRLVTRYGLLNTGKRLAMFLTHLDQGLSKIDAQRMGTAMDVVLHTRQHTLDGVGDEMAGSALGQNMRNLTAGFTRLTGVAHWDAMMRLLSSQMEQDALFRAITKGNLSAIEKGKLAAHGIGDAELPAIREQWLKHGSDEIGLNRARTELWDNKDAAGLVEQAVQRAASSTAFFVGKGDMPRFASSEFGKLMVQFKAFVIASVNRLAIPLAQGIAHRDIMAANGLISLLTLGALSTWLKDKAAGRVSDWSHPGHVVADAAARSGILAYAPDLYDPVAGMLHLPRFSKFQDLDPLQTLEGATFGMASTLIDTVRRTSKGNLTAADIHKLRQLLPYQNVFYLTRLVNLLEGKTEDALDVKNAPGKNAADYFNPNEDTNMAEKPDKAHLFNMEQIPNAF